MKKIHASVITIFVASILVVLTLPLGEVQFARYMSCELNDCENGICSNKICSEGTKFGSISYLYVCNGMVYDTITGYSWGQCIFNDEIQKIK